MLAVFVAEGLVWQRNLDLEAIQRVLYYQMVELPAHERDPSPVLHYGLRPNGRFQQATISASGLRNPVPPDDASGLRVLVSGGSTIYGYRVRDEETLPARLGHHLGDAAVWNLGVSAYVEAQVIERARIWLERLGDIDLIVLVVTNPGRRPFLGDAPFSRADLRAALRDDPGFSEENLPPLWGAGNRDLHHLLLRLSPSWRYFTAVRAGQLDRDDPLRDPSRIRNQVADALRAAAQAAGTPVVFVDYPNNPPACPGCWRGDAHVSLERPGLTQTDRDLHPPAASLDAHAAFLADQLLQTGLISTNR